MRGRRTALALRWALVMTGILGLLWTGVQWISVIATNYKSATSYGAAIAAEGIQRTMVRYADDSVSVTHAGTAQVREACHRRRHLVTDKGWQEPQSPENERLARLLLT